MSQNGCQKPKTLFKNRCAKEKLLNFCRSLSSLNIPLIRQILPAIFRAAEQGKDPFLVYFARKRERGKGGCFCGSEPPPKRPQKGPPLLPPTPPPPPPLFLPSVRGGMGNCIRYFLFLPPPSCPYLRKRGVGWRDKIDFPCSSVALPRFQSQGQGRPPSRGGKGKKEDK